MSVFKRLGDVPQQCLRLMRLMLNFARGFTEILRRVRDKTHQLSKSVFGFLGIAARTVFRLLSQPLRVEGTQIRVSNYWLNVIEVSKDGHVRVFRINSYHENQPIPIDQAVGKLEESIHNRASTLKKKLVVFCLQDLDKVLSGTEALFSPNLPKSVAAQVSRIGFHNPINVRTTFTGQKDGKVHWIGNSVVDLSHDRSIIIGNASAVVATIESLMTRLRITDTSSSEAICQRLNEVLLRYTISPVGSGALIGGIAGVYSLLSAIFLTKAFNSSPVYLSLIAAGALGLFSNLGFLVLEIFQERFIILSSRWTIVTKMISFVFLFSLIIGLLPFASLQFVSVPTASTLIAADSFLLATSVAIGSFRQVFSNLGLSKGFVLLWWFFMMVFLGGLLALYYA